MPTLNVTSSLLFSFLFYCFWIKISLSSLWGMNTFSKEQPVKSLQVRSFHISRLFQPQTQTRLMTKGLSWLCALLSVTQKPHNEVYESSLATWQIDLNIAAWNNKIHYLSFSRSGIKVWLSWVFRLWVFYNMKLSQGLTGKNPSQPHSARVCGRIHFLPPFLMRSSSINS